MNLDVSQFRGSASGVLRTIGAAVVEPSLLFRVLRVLVIIPVSAHLEWVSRWGS